MAKRCATYVLAGFVVISTLGFACPHVYGVPMHTHESPQENGMAGTEPHHENDHHKPPTSCYRVLHDRVFSPPTQFVSLVTLVALPAVSITPMAPDAILQSLVDLFHSPPNLALSILSHVLRI